MRAGHSVNPTGGQQGPDDRAAGACGSPPLHAVADAARRGREAGGSVYVPARCPAAYADCTPASARYAPTVRA
jgi:hypothetical protein